MKDILHIEVWASKDNPIHVEWDYIYLHLIYEVVVDSKLESALLDHSQLHLLSDPTQGIWLRMIISLQSKLIKKLCRDQI